MTVPPLAGKRKLVASLGLSGLIAALPITGPYGELVKATVIALIAIAHQFAQAGVDKAALLRDPGSPLPDISLDGKKVSKKGG